jgi:hypothetical protein
MTTLREQRQPAGVIEMPVGEQDGIEFLLRAGRRTIQGLGFFSALEKSAIYKDAGLFCLNVISGAGDFSAGGANNCNLHRWLVKRS